MMAKHNVILPISSQSYPIYFVGHGGALVESKPFDRKVVGLNPALAAT